MSPEEIDRFLAEPRLAHFATVDGDGSPRIRPIWFLWRDGALWFTTRRSARATGRDVAAGSRAAVSIASEDRPYRAVIAWGTPEIMEKDRDLLLAVATRYGEAAGRRWTAAAMEEADRVILMMAPQTLLSWNYARERTDGSKRTSL